MTDDHLIPDDSGVTDLQRGWAVYRCPHGCLHMALGAVTVSLTAEEFDALMGLMARARHQLASPAPAQRRSRTH
jgi:hypothetical protein